MSMEQCNRCLYRDTLVALGNGAVHCPVAEKRADRTEGMCTDFEADDDRWDEANQQEMTT